MNLNEFKDFVRQNFTLKDRIDELTAIQSEVKKSIREGVLELGEENERGHIVVEINDDVTGIRSVMNQRKVSKVLDIEIAEELLKEKGLHERCIQMIPVLNEDEIMSAYYDELLTEADIDKMFPSKVSWALVNNKG
jgi:putative component of toxin-antitoxin plasmid stabilization module